jgi:hypothetical protein
VQVKQFLLHVWHPSCYKPANNSWMKKGPDCDYNGTYPWSFVTHTPTVAVNQVGGDRKTFYIMKFNLTTRNPWLSIYLVSSKEIMIGTTNSGLSANSGSRVSILCFSSSKWNVEFTLFVFVCALWCPTYIDYMSIMESVLW